MTASVLLVEDSAIVAKDVEMVLKRLGHAVCGWVTRGEEAVEQACAVRPDLVLMDIKLAGSMDGVTAAQLIRERCHVPVVFLTAHADSSTVERAKAIEPFGYIIKPFEKHDLQVTIELALHKHRMERKLREREQWLATTLGSIGDAVVATDADGLLTFMNVVAEQLTGWNGEEARGRPLEDVVQLVDEVTRDPVQDVFELAKLGGSIANGQQSPLLLQRGEALIPVEDSLAPIRSDDRGVTGFVLVFRDVTERRQNEQLVERTLKQLEEANEELKEHDDFLTALFESIPSAVIVVDQEHRIRMVNSSTERDFRVRRNEIIGACTGDLLQCPHASGPDAAPCGCTEACQVCDLWRPIRAAFAGERIERKRVEVMQLVDGRERSLVVLVSAALLRRPDEELVIVILEDVTELMSLRQLVGVETSFAGIVGTSPQMHSVFESIREVADVDVSVLVQGESGTGKELVARAIHEHGSRSEGPFVPVNCGAIPEGLIESELFGHVKGAFTGALRDRKGRFQQANGGTIFLDEVADLPQPLQVKLLHVLQEGRFNPVGGERTVDVDVRVVSASNKDLREQVASGSFREDLYYRLCVVPIFVPPLRERAGDIPLLAEYLLAAEGIAGKREPSSVTEEALAILVDYSWPGNVRELRNAMQYAAIKSKGGAIAPEHLPDTVRGGSGQLVAMAAAQVFEPRPRTKLTRNSVAAALRETEGNRSAAARRLGVSRATLYRFLGRQNEPSE